MYYIYIDEAGRGPLAGPVQVGLVIEKVQVNNTVRDSLEQFPARNPGLYNEFKDSKILSEGQRNALYKTIVEENNIAYASAKISASDIDRHGIVWALRTAILRALHTHFVGGKYTLSSLKTWIASQSFQVTLVIDGPSDFGIRKALGITVIPVIDGDAKIPMISCASIIAKVERDAYMYRASKRFPEYEFHLHKGYGTKGHYEAIKKFGLCKEHRVSYIHTT